MQITFKYDILNELFTAEPSHEPANTGLPSLYSAFGGRVVLVNCYGNISLAGIDKFKPTLFAALTGEARQIVIGLEDVTDFSRSALGVLVNFASSVLGRGKKLYILSPPEKFLQTLTELQLTMFFMVLRDQGELLCILPDE